MVGKEIDWQVHSHGTMSNPFLQYLEEAFDETHDEVEHEYSHAHHEYEEEYEDEEDKEQNELEKRNIP